MYPSSSLVCFKSAIDFGKPVCTDDIRQMAKEKKLDSARLVIENIDPDLSLGHFVAYDKLISYGYLEDYRSHYGSFIKIVRTYYKNLLYYRDLREKGLE